HTFGNLTILTQALNSKLSNAEFSKKKTHFRNSLLVLNKYFEGFETWDESAILGRGDDLFNVARSIWPVPDDLAHEAAGFEPSDVEIDIFDVPDDAGPTDYRQEQLYEEIARLLREKDLEQLLPVKADARGFISLN